MFACNYMEQQRLSSEIGIQMHTCESNNPNDKFTANDFFNEEIRSQYYMFMKNIRGTAAYWADILANLLATVRCLGPPTLFVTLSADDNYWPELKMLLQNITYEEATRNSPANEQMRKDPLLTSLHPVGGGTP